MRYHDRINLITNETLQKYTYYWQAFSTKIFTNIFYKIIPLSHRIDLFFAKGSEANNQARVTFSNKIAWLENCNNFLRTAHKQD